MSQMAARYAADAGIFHDRRRQHKPRSRFTLHWWPLLGPAEYWPVPHSVDEVFQALAWLMDMSWPERNARYTPAGLLRGGGAVRVQPWPAFIMDGWPTRAPVAAAHAAFQRLVLGKSYAGPEVHTWRERVGIIAWDDNALRCAPQVVTKPAYAMDGGPLSNHDAAERLEQLLTCAGRGNLTDQHNPCHSRAVYPMSVRMSLCHRLVDAPDGEQWKATCAVEQRRKRWSIGWQFDLRYGFPPPDRSVWLLPLATQAPAETFVDAMLRAESALHALTAADPSRTVDPGADVRVHLSALERSARMWGASPDAICRGVRRFKRGADWWMEAGAREDGSPEWSAVWLGHGPRSGFAGRERLDGWGPVTWPPDRRTDHLTGVTVDHKGKPVDAS